MLKQISLIVFAVVFISFIVYTGRKNNNYIRLNDIFANTISTFKKENGHISISQLLFFIGVPLGFSFCCAVEKTTTETILVALNYSVIGIAIVLTGILLICCFEKKKENKNNTLLIIKETVSFVLTDIAICFFEVFACIWISINGEMNDFVNSWLVYFLMGFILLSLFLILKRLHVILTADYIQEV